MYFVTTTSLMDFYRKHVLSRIIFCIQGLPFQKAQWIEWGGRGYARILYKVNIVFETYFLKI